MATTMEMVTNVALQNILDDVSQYIEYTIDSGTTHLEVPPDVANELAALDAPPTAAIPRQNIRPKEDRGQASRVYQPVSTAVAGAPPADDATTSDDGELQEIAKTIAACEKCSLHKTRTKTVPGQGCTTPEIMFIGEAPGEDEDHQGLAFVGKAGQLLTKMIAAMGYTRDQVFIGNILKCRPPNNRPPTPDEMSTCIPYLKAQIALLKPKVIITLGGTAVRGLTGNPIGITKLRGHWLSYEGVDLMPTYHPSYLLRFPPSKKEAWEDLKAVLERLGKKPPPRKA